MKKRGKGPAKKVVPLSSVSGPEAELQSKRLSEIDAASVNRTMEEIVAADPNLTTEEQHREFVEKSRPEDSPTHHLFEWDPKKQSEIYLLERARALVISVRIVYAAKPESPVRAWPVVVKDGKRGYRQMTEIVRRKEMDMLTAMIEQAKLDAENWIRKWQRLENVSELAGLFTQMRKVANRK